MSKIFCRIAGASSGLPPETAWIVTAEKRWLDTNTTPDDPATLSANIVDDLGYSWIAPHTDGVNRFTGEPEATFRSTDSFRKFRSAGTLGRFLHALPLLVLIAPWSRAQTRDSHDAGVPSQEVQLRVVDGHDLRFAHLTTANGLSEDVVQQECQDDQGFLWFGTLDGLNRYDGYEFKVRKRGIPNAELGGTTLAALFKDRSGKLWIGVDQYLDGFDPITERIVEYQHNPQISTSLGGSVFGITQDREGYIWLGTSNGLDKLDPSTGVFTHFRHEDGNPTSLEARMLRNDIRSVTVDDSDTLWVETSAGVNSFDPRTGKATRFPQLLNHDEFHEQRAYQDRSGRLWIHSREGSGLGIFNPKTREFVRYRFSTADNGAQTAERVTSVLQDKQGVLWFGTQGSGLLKLDPRDKSLVRYRNDPADPNSLSNNFVLSLYEDLEGNIWAGTGGGGINRFPSVPAGFKSYQKRAGDKNSLDQNFVLSIFKDSRDDLWVGNDSVLNRINVRTGQFTFYRHRAGDNGSITDGTVLSTVEDKSGRLWFATYRGGLNTWDRQTGKFRAYRHNKNNPDSPSSDVIMRLLTDPRGTIWVASGHALDEFDAVSTHFRHHPELNAVLSAGLVTCLAEDRRGALWLGTNQAGLVRFDPATGRIEIFRNQPGNTASLGSDRVNALLEDRRGTLWVGTQLGLSRFDAATEEFHTYTEQDRLPSSAVQGILEDQQGTLWIGTNKGLAKYNPDTHSVRSYYAADGLAGNEFNYWGAAFRDPRGEMFFPGANGLTYFSPDQIRENSYSPPVVLTDFRLFGTPVDVGRNSPLQESIPAIQSLTLRPSENVFSLGFSSLSYVDPQRNLYRYMLEGLEHQWNYTNSTRRFATYTTLAPGGYVFRVQGSNNHGLWNENGVSLHIRILAPWWDKTWFHLLCAVLILASLWAAYQWRLRQLHYRFEIALEARVDERTRMARDIHDTLLQSFQGVLPRLQVVSQLLRERPIEAQEMLDSTMELASEAIAEGRDAVQGLRESAVERNDLAPAIRTFGEELACDSTADPPAFRVTVEGQPRDLHPLIRDEVYRIAAEALRNAFCHAQPQQVEVEIRYDFDRFRLRVRDDGKGMDRAILSRQAPDGHYGLAGMRERAILMGGTLKIWSEVGTGTEVELTTPAATTYKAGRRRSWFSRTPAVKP